MEIMGAGDWSQAGTELNALTAARTNEVEELAHVTLILEVG
jgi:hypothetical protein